jgi:hypothetical protein
MRFLKQRVVKKTGISRLHGAGVKARRALAILLPACCICIVVIAITPARKVYVSGAQSVRLSTYSSINMTDWFPKAQTMHVCGPHLTMVPDILRHRGYQPINASENIAGWGVILGGHIHCGAHPLDEAMTSGLNALLLKHAGVLPKHSVYHSCLGCRESICHKRNLCILAKWHGFEGRATPECYILPTEHGALEASFKLGAKWVHKEDGKHRGEGVTLLNATSMQQLPTAASLTVAQKFIDSDRPPIRVYVSVTSSYPFRAHVYCHTHRLYPDLSETSVFGLCQRHWFHHVENTLTLDNAPIVLDTDILANISLAVITSVKSIVIASISSISSHAFNRVLQRRESRCFTFWAFDLALTSSGEALAYEVNEFPYIDPTVPAPRFYVKQSHVELFDMLGLYGGDLRAGLAPASVECLQAFCELHLCSRQNSSDITRTLVLLEHELATARVWSLLVEEDPLLPESPKGSMAWAQREYLAHRRATCAV